MTGDSLESRLVAAAISWHFAQSAFHSTPRNIDASIAMGDAERQLRTAVRELLDEESRRAKPSEADRQDLLRPSTSEESAVPLEDTADV